MYYCYDHTYQIGCIFEVYFAHNSVINTTKINVSSAMVDEYSNFKNGVIFTFEMYYKTNKHHLVGKYINTTNQHVY